MGRKRTNRDVPLYTRVKKENFQVLTRLCKKASISKTQWVDTQLDALRKKGIEACQKNLKQSSARGL